MTIVANGRFSPVRQPNERLRRARLRMPMSRQQLAEAINAHVFHTTGIWTAMDAHYVARLEQGKRRWPNAAYRAAFRAVLGVANDAEIGFHFRSTADEAFAAANERGMIPWVRESRQRQPITLDEGDEAIVRLPTDPERRELRLPMGIPVIQIRSAGTTTDILPADAVSLRGPIALAVPNIDHPNGSDQPIDRHT
jgi:transcriptional regulator with XRE-family HTH domain